MRRAMEVAARRLLGVIISGAAVGALAAPAGAATTATVAHDALAGGSATYAADAEANRLTISGGNAGTVVFADAGATITAPVLALPAINGCVVDPVGGRATCPASPRPNIALADGGDEVSIGPDAPPVFVLAGDGADTLVDPSPSPGTAFDGAEGTDRADYSGRTTPVTVTLGNGVADDGDLGEGDNIAAEDVTGGSDDDSITGDAGANGLLGGGGNDLLIGGAGQDAPDGGPGDDTIFAADRIAETVDCGAGTGDSVVADLGAGGVADTLLDCENVARPSTPVGGSNGAAAPGSSAATVGLVTVLAPGVANPADLTPPSASLRAAIRQKVRTVGARGVELRVACTEACGISAALSIARPAARRLGLAGRTGGAVVGTATARRATPGTVRIRVRLSRRARQALRRTRRLVVTAQVLVSDASANATLLQRRVTLVR